MTPAQGLRKIAHKEWNAGHILTVRELMVGVRFKFPYLKESLQAWLDEEPEGELANKLYVVGMNSLDPVLGHGHVSLTSKWVITPRRSTIANPQARPVALYFSEDTTEELLKLLRREHEMHITELIRELEDTFFAARHAGDPSDYLVEYGRAEASFSLSLDQIGGSSAFDSWVRALLASKLPRPDIMPASI